MPAKKQKPASNGIDSTVVIGGGSSLGYGPVSYTYSPGATVGGISTYDWSTSSATTSYTLSNGITSTVSIDTDGLTMKEGCDIKIGDRSLKQFMDQIDEKLAILHPNPELEEKWENLKGLRKAYMELEKEILEKEKMWKILKDS